MTLINPQRMQAPHDQSSHQNVPTMEPVGAFFVPIVTNEVIPSSDSFEP